jgi:hypothetical protein
MNADGTHQHLVHTGLKGVVDVVWGSAPLLPDSTPSRIFSRPVSPVLPAASSRAECLVLPAVVSRAACSR